ncbi:DNA-binding protein [Streptomyces abyssalis]|uniref:DNA-binding protein n=1 Tax=Streptomyces abyssalis TaxID=933944 RepID=A0A1E7JHC3_9ACTN|nr:HU family DNA-binding protein [Streptomyces abyssalis]OEU85847.1 DNA-binding protein [Streptomyces abyssalis]OEU92689.1 DNA-binding protein [Streptomyces abyssalis]
MNKAQLVEAIQDKLGGRQQAADAVDVVLDAIVRSVVSGERVSVTGFGSFEKVDRPARYARNPQTGERVRVRKTSVPRFRAGAGFKELVSGAKKLPKNDVAVKKAPKGSLMGGTSAKKSATKRAAVKKATAAKKTAAKKATAAKKTAAKRMPAKKTAAAKKSTAKKTAAKKTAAKKTTAKKTAAKKTTAKKSAAKKATAKKAPARKAPGRRTAARKTTAKRATARKR